MWKALRNRIRLSALGGKARSQGGECRVQRERRGAEKKRRLVRNQQLARMAAGAAYVVQSEDAMGVNRCRDRCVAWV